MVAKRLNPRTVSAPQRGKKRKKQKHGDGDHGDHDDSAHEEATKIKNVQRIQFGKYMIDTWYYSPFPQVCAPPASVTHAEIASAPDRAGVIGRSTSGIARCSSANSR